MDVCRKDRGKGEATMKNDHAVPNIWKGALAGLVAGLVASWTMDRFQAVWLAVSSPNAPKNGEDISGQDEEKSSFKNEQPNNQTPSANDESEDDATVKTASAISEGVFSHKLTPSEKNIAGPAVHYAVGATSGIVYGVASEFLPEVTKGFGLPYGTAFWLVVDEGVVPLLRLSKPPTAYPISTHIYALVSHLVFGATAEGVRRLLRG